MQRLLICVTISLLIIANGFGQMIKRPAKVKPTDFETSTGMKVLYQRTLVTFPFREDVSSGNVTDKQFKLSLEFIIRVLLNKSDCNKNFPLLSTAYTGSLKVTSIDYYTLEKNKIKKTDIEKSLIKTEKDGDAIQTNFSSMMKDSVAIIDLFYSIVSDNKDSIIILNYNDIPLQDTKITIDIPEFYAYSSVQKSDCFESETSNRQGYVRGYKLANSNSSITGKAIAEAMKIQFPKAEYRPVYYKVHSTSYIWKSNCSSEKSNALLKLSISGISELK